MKRMRNLVLILTCIAIIGGSFQSLAAGEYIEDEYGTREIIAQNVSVTSKIAGITWNGKDNKITAKATIKTMGSCNISITMYLQKQGSKIWSPVKKWTGTFNGTAGSLSEPYTLTSSGSYRVHVVFQVDGTTYTATSNEIKYLDNTYIQSMDSYE